MILNLYYTLITGERVLFGRTIIEVVPGQNNSGDVVFVKAERISTIWPCTLLCRYTTMLL